MWISPHFGGGSGLKQTVERLETQIRHISPHFGGGSGLKLVVARSDAQQSTISPHFGGGSGLKHPCFWPPLCRRLISPHFGGGSGLKRKGCGIAQGLARNLPSLRWGERIETRAYDTVSQIVTCISPHFGGGSGLKLYNYRRPTVSLSRSPLTSVGGAD